jgi:hypothetical protein
VRLGFARRCEINSSPRGGPPQWVNCGTSGEGSVATGLPSPETCSDRVCSAAEAEKKFCAAGVSIIDPFGRGRPGR